MSHRAYKERTDFISNDDQLKRETDETEVSFKVLLRGEDLLSYHYVSLTSNRVPKYTDKDTS